VRPARTVHLELTHAVPTWCALACFSSFSRRCHNSLLLEADSTYANSTEFLANAGRQFEPSVDQYKDPQACLKRPKLPHIVSLTTSHVLKAHLRRLFESERHLPFVYLATVRPCQQYHATHIQSKHAERSFIVLLVTAEYCERYLLSWLLTSEGRVSGASSEPH
jgi:hypothetical protein